MAELNEQPRREVQLTVQDYENEGQKTACISEVPRLYRDQNPSCFDPQVICIGPVHRAHKNVQEHKGLKATYMHDLLARLNSRPSEQILKDCRSKVVASIEQIKKCYEGGLMKYKFDDSELADMMVTDACFILEFLLKRLQNELSIPPGNRFVMNHIICDLVLLENQIPFFVLQDIFECAGVEVCVQGDNEDSGATGSCCTSLIEVLLTAFKATGSGDNVHSGATGSCGTSLIEILLTVVQSTMNPFKATGSGDNVHSGATGSRDNVHSGATGSPDNVHSGATGSLHSDRDHYKHILDVLLKAYKPPNENEYLITKRYSSVPVSHSAVELDLAGVKFKPINQDEKWKMKIEYESSWFSCFLGPTLRMPVMDIHDKTELLLRNLIAYEQSAPINGYYFTSYACAMDMLVDNKEDVSRLVESKVIDNKLGSNESAANLINNIFYGLYYEEFYYEAQWKKLDDYCKRCWPKNAAWLRHKYFTNPWAMIGLLAGILLFLLTAIQTYYSYKAA